MGRPTRAELLERITYNPDILACLAYAFRAIAGARFAPRLVHAIV
jgi:hypothetical protein